MNMTKCDECGHVFDEIAISIPCPECGSSCRTISAVVTDNIAVHDGLEFKVKNPSLTGKRKVRTEGFRKYANSKSDGRLVLHQRIIDRARDKYSELVEVVGTGEIIRCVKEKLSEHSGHGSAKFEKSPPD